VEIKKAGFENASDEVKEKIRACKTPEDYLALAKSEGYELSDEDLESISGGVDWISCTSVCCCPGVHKS